MHCRQCRIRRSPLEQQVLLTVSRSTLYDYLTGKVEIGCTRGPDSVLTAAEEERLVEYALHMADIGYGRS